MGRSVEDNKLPSELILEDVANCDNVDVLDLPSLGETVDPDALDELLSTATDLTISFEYHGYIVRVNTEGTVTIDEN